MNAGMPLSPRPVADHRPDPIAAHSSATIGGARQIGSRFAAHRVAAVAEAALRGKDRLPGAHLLRRIRLRRRVAGGGTAAGLAWRAAAAGRRAAPRPIAARSAR